MFSLSKSVSKLKSLSKNKSSDKTDQSLKEVKKTKRRNVAKPEAKPKRLTSGVVQISNIPHGFYEKQMFGYFSQFGKVLKLRISKNRKTGNRRNYGFIEFECEEVAKIAAETMNNYLMFDHILKCEFIPKAKIKEKPKLFKNWNKEFVSTALIHKSLHNKNKSIEREFQLMRKRLKSVRKMEEFLKQKGLDFKCEVIDFPDMLQLRQKAKQTVVELKTPKSGRQPTDKRQSVSKPFETVVLSSKTSEKRSKGFKSPLYPRLLKYTILMSANKKRVI